MNVKLTAEDLRTAIFNGSSYASYDGAQYYANGINMQAIADELNTRAERTCNVTMEQHSGMNEIESAFLYVIMIIAFPPIVLVLDEVVSE